MKKETKNYVTKKDAIKLTDLFRRVVEDAKEFYQKEKLLKRLEIGVILDYLNKFIQNNYWRRKYKNAPSYLCKLYIAIQFCRSYEDFVKDGKDKQLIDECYKIEWFIEYNMIVEDMIYMRDNMAGSVQAKANYDIIAKLFSTLKEGDEFSLEPHGSDIYNPHYICCYSESEEPSYCPRCGVILDDQDKFDKNNKVNNCANCGKALINPSNNDNLKYKDIVWICDKCGDLLNNQKDFTDLEGIWKCTKCGCVNDVTDENIE